MSRVAVSPVTEDPVRGSSPRTQSRLENGGGGDAARTSAGQGSQKVQGSNESSAYIFGESPPDHAKGSSNHITYAGVKVAKSTIAILKEFDRNGDGKLDIWEVGGLVEQMSRERVWGVLLRRMLLALVIMTILILAAVVGLSWAAAIYTKETKMSSGGVMTDKSTGDAVQVAEYLQMTKLSSDLTMDVLRRVKYLELKSPTGATMHVFVEGLFKIPNGTSSYLKIVAGSMGVIKVVGTTISFESSATASLFQEAGFTVVTTSSGRHLLQNYEDPFAITGGGKIGNS